jgi:lysine-N-methylase
MTAVALRYMLDFRCIGPACEDHCCGSWGVAVDQGHHAKIRRALARSGRKDADRLFTLRPPGQRSAAHFATIEMTAGGACPLLDPDRLCSLHRHHGEDLLPDACAMYPRVVSRLGPRLELSGALSCPEVARRALLAEDATDTVPLAQGAPALGRAVVQKDAASLPLALSGPALDLWRSTLFGLLSHRGPDGAEAPPLASQLFFCAFLAQRVDRQGEIEEPELDRLCTPGSLAALHDRFTEARAGIPVALHVVLAVLGRRLRPAGTSAFHRVVGEVMRSYAAEEGAGVHLRELASPDEGGSEVEIDRDALQRAYQRRREALAPAHAGLLDRALRNYGRNYFVREWPVRGEPGSGAGDLFAHVQVLLLRLALLRFLLCSHPAAQAQQDLLAHKEDPTAPAAFARLVIEGIYAFSRIVEHHDGFGAGVQQMLREHMGELGHAISLINV